MRKAWKAIRSLARRSTRLPAVREVCPKCGERIYLADHAGTCAGRREEEAVSENALVALDSGPLTAEAILRRRAIVADVVEKLFRENVHFGLIPGTKEKGLWQAGAELLASTFGLAVEVDEAHETIGAHVVYTGTVRLSVIASKAFVGSAKGICSTGEEKMAWREPVCEAEYVKAEVSRLKYKKGEDEPKKQVATSLEDARNSAMKRAVKRALVSATRTALAVSDLFRNGEEDDGEAHGGKRGRGKAEPNVSQVTGAIEEVSGTGKWWGVKIAGTMFKSDDKAMREVAAKAQGAGLRVSLTFQEIESGSGPWKKILGLKALEGASTAESPAKEAGGK